MVAWFKEVRDTIKKGEGCKKWGGQICKTWRLVKNGKAKESQRRVLPIFWFLIWITGVCALPTGQYWPLNHGRGWNLER